MWRGSLGWIVVALALVSGCPSPDTSGDAGTSVDASGSDARATDSGAVDGGSTDGGTTDGGPGDAGPIGTAHIVASVGGTISSDDGIFTLTIPPGALAADTDIGVRTVPAAEHPAEAATATSGVYELTPDGLTFLVPATATYTFTTPPPGTVMPDAVALFEEEALSAGTVTASPHTRSIRRVDGSLVVSAEVPHLSFHWVSTSIYTFTQLIVRAGMPSGEQFVGSRPFASTAWNVSTASGSVFPSSTSLRFRATSVEAIADTNPFMESGWTPMDELGTWAGAPARYVSTLSPVGSIGMTGPLPPPFPAWTCVRESHPESWIRGCAQIGGSEACLESTVTCVDPSSLDVTCSELARIFTDAEPDPPGIFDRAVWVFPFPCRVTTTEPGPISDHVATLGTLDTGGLFIDTNAGPWRLLAANAPVDHSYARVLPSPGVPTTVSFREVATGARFDLTTTGNDKSWEVTAAGPGSGPLPHLPGQYPCFEPHSFPTGTVSGTETIHGYACDESGVFGICTLEDAICTTRALEFGFTTFDGGGPYVRRGPGWTITAHSAGTGTSFISGMPRDTDVTFTVTGSSVIDIVLRWTSAGTVEVVSVTVR